MIIDGLPIGSVFAFLWNLLVSVSFQFVGFLLTYLLHTSHASKFGSRAGLGITLIQYGFYMRSPDAQVPLADGDSNSWGTWPDSNDSNSSPSSTAARNIIPNIARAIIRSVKATPLPDDAWNTTTTVHDLSEPSGFIGGGNASSPFTSNDWLSFLLMTVGWFILITSVLGFWRVKRWERGVQASTVVEREATPEEIARDVQVLRSIEQAFGLNGWNVRGMEQREVATEPPVVPFNGGRHDVPPITPDVELTAAGGDAASPAVESGGRSGRRGGRRRFEWVF